MTCPGHDAVLRHTQFRTKLNDIPGSEHSLQLALVGMHHKTCPGRDTVLQHAWSGRSFMCI